MAAMTLCTPVPKIAALPIIFAWFGLGDLSKIVIIVASTVFALSTLFPGLFPHS